MSDDELRAKKNQLSMELQRKIWHAEYWRNSNKRTALGLIGFAIVASVTAGIMGLMGSSSKAVGLVSFIPGALTLFATTFDFQRRANVHREMGLELKHLKGRFDIEMPTLPSADQITFIHREMVNIESRISKEQEAITINFSRFDK